MRERAPIDLVGQEPPAGRRVAVIWPRRQRLGRAATRPPGMRRMGGPRSALALYDGSERGSPGGGDEQPMDPDAWAASVRARQAEADRRCWGEAIRLAAAFRDRGAQRVVLFGSVARHQSSSTSDVDLAVVLPGADGEPVGARGLEILAAAAPEVPVDLLVYTPDEWASVRQRAWVRREIVERGVTLFEC